MLTPGEAEYLEGIEQRVKRLKIHLADQRLPQVDNASRDWFAFLAAMKEIVGNPSNDMSFVACLMAKEYLAETLHLAVFDVSAKPQGAPCLDINERTVDGQRVIGEIKTTVPYLSHDLGAQQRDAFNKDFAKLNREQADHKFFFVTDQRTFDVMKRRYVSLIPGVTIVLLTTGEAFDAADPADSALSN